MKSRKRKVIHGIGVILILGLMATALPLQAANEAPPRIYTFKEVGDIAQLNSSEIIRQKATLVQAEQNKETQLTNYQNQVNQFYSPQDPDPDSEHDSGRDSVITESSLLGLQDSYESALNSYDDAEETMDKLKPKAAYQAQKLYIDILMSEVQIRIQEKEIQRLKDEYELAKVKTAFGSFTQTQLTNAKAQWENAVDTLDSLKETLKSNKNSMREYLNLADTVEFGLEDPPVFGQYAKDFDEKEVLTEALKNYLSLKQAKREVDELGERIRRYIGADEQSKVDQLSASGPGKDIALRETTQSLTRTVENTMKEYRNLDANLDKAKENLYTAQRTYITARMKLGMGTATLNEVRNAEKAVLTAEKEVAQAQYNGYLGAKKVMLLKEGILVN